MCDRLQTPGALTAIGNVCLGSAFLLIGPVPFLTSSFHHPTSLSTVIGMVAVFAFGYALVLVSSFNQAEKAAQEIGFKDDIGTYLMISGDLLVFTIYFLRSEINGAH